jgi:hypothetical protein
MRSPFVLAVCLASTSFLSAQQSLFQSSDGQTAVYLWQSSAASLNLGDSKASVGYFRRINTQNTFLGFEGYATANSGVTSLFSSDKPKAPEGGGDFILGRHFALVRRPKAGERGGSEDWWLVDAGYGHSSFYLYPTGSTPTSNTAKTKFDRFRALAAYNYFTNGNLLVGIATGAERRNNLSDLTSVTLETVIVPAPTGSQSSVVTNRAGYYGNYKEYIAAPIYTDLLYYPEKATVPGLGNRIAIDFFSRSDIAATNRSSSGGFGVFIFGKDDKGNPDLLKPLGGITASFNGTKIQLSLTVGFTFAKSN